MIDIGLRRPGHRQPWDEAADAELARRIGEGALLRDIAIAMGRTQEAVRSRANVLKLPVRSSVRPRRAGFSGDQEA
jgi:hypothetical protein